MKHKTAKAIFNEPVDVEHDFPDYLDVVKHPMDFGSILAKLEAGEASGWADCEYESPAAVLGDVELIWSNCVTYNSTDADWPTREACAEVRAIFENKWKAAGLLDAEQEPSDGAAEEVLAEQIAAEGPAAEGKVPQRFTLRPDDQELLVRLLDDFCIASAADPEDMQPLDALEDSDQQLVARGAVVAVDDTKTRSHKDDMAEQAAFVEAQMLALMEAQADEAAGKGQSKGRDKPPTLHVIGGARGGEDAEEPADLPGEMGGPQELVRSQRLKLKKDHRDSPDAKRLRLGPKLGSPDGKSQRLKLKLGGAERPSSGSRRSRQQQEEASPEPDSPAVPEGSQRSQRLRLKLKQQWESVEATPELGAGEGSQRPHRTNRPSFKLRMIEDEAPKSKGIKVRLPGGRHEPSPEDGTGSERRVSRRPSRRFDAASPDLLDDEDEGDASPQALMPRKRSRLAGEDDEADDDEFVPSANAARREMGLAQRRLHYHQKRQAEAERRRKQRLAETRIRVKRERAANEARGPPPEPTRSFRASMDRVPDLIMTWELCQALGQLLQLPPFPLWRLEAALFPGPRDPTFKAEPTSAEADALVSPGHTAKEGKKGKKARQHKADKEEKVARQGDAARESDAAATPAAAEDEEARKSHRLRVKLGAKLMARKAKAPAAAVSASPAKAAAAPKSAGKASAAKARPAAAAPITPAPASAEASRPAAVDPEGAASGLLLRELHCALVRAWEGKGLDASKPQPSVARLYGSDSAGVPWTERVSTAILTAPEDVVDEECREAAIRLSYAAYSDLEPSERMTILRALCNMALASEAVRDHISSRVEAMAGPRGKAKDRVEEESESAQEEGLDGNGEGAKAKPDRGAAGSSPPDAWMKWMDKFRLGMRKPLGFDYKRRKFWALGGPAGAWRIYVEEEEGRLWGWYEGQNLVDFVEWLGKGRIERETNLLKALSAVPLPRKPEGAAGTASSEAELRPVLTGKELDLRRPDGFKNQVVPQLRGEGNWDKIRLYSSVENRIFACVDALMGCVPFWLKGVSWLRQQCMVSDELAAARTPLEMGRALQQVERMLMEADVMGEEWVARWQAAWRQSVLKCGDMRESILHVASLQEHMKRAFDVLPRNAFTSIARNLQCQLYFPFPGEQVAEAPTTRSVASPSLMPVGPLAEAQMRQQWEALEELVKALKPVERYKVAGIAYRRGLVDTTPEDRAAILEGVLPRWPACWLLLRPSRLGPRHQQAAAEIALPIQINNALPDFIVKMDVFDRGLQRQWRAGDTFRMFFGAKTRDRAGGVYYNGTIRNVMQQQVAATASQHEREGYDPWESLEVEWDGANENDSCERVSPWEVEVDPEEEARREEERKKQEEAAARLSRAEAKARRLAGLLAGELEGGGEDGEAGEDGARAGDADWTPAMSPGASPANSEGAAPTREYNRRPPMRVGLEGSMVPRDLLEQLRELTREQFKTLLTNWYRRVKGKFKVPIFAHQELDLHLVFFEVQDRGGYDHVTAQKLWKDVCRCLGLDLRGQTSASYNMRLNYEKCLLDFEAYLASGDYTADLAADTAPSTDSITEQERKSMVATYTPGNVGLGPSRLASASLPGSAPQLRASRDPRLAGEGGSAGYNPSTASGAWTAAELEDNMSFTDLLTGPLDGDLPMAAPRPPPTSGPGREGSAPTGKRGPGRPRKHPLPGSAAATATPGSAKGGSGGARRKAAASLQLEPAWLRMVAPVGVTTGPSQLGKGWVASTQAVPPVVAASAEPPRAPPPPLGVLLHALGAELVGRRVMRNWPDNGGWWEARVSDYRRSGCHKLTYDAGTAQESFEWVDFRELGDDEIWQHAEGPQLMAEDSLHPVPGKPNPMATIMAALKAGIAPNVLHRMPPAEAQPAENGQLHGSSSKALPRLTIKLPSGNLDSSRQ
ncbi:hypothetical protein WJX72_010057 [[Myrmecia] bisecta]|uniref:Uncharacterized protein n=1 Tax=[Myrmecia] bisecta TaxID=41462 RepID=A0AAW1QSJ2_9CHLO